MIQKTFVILTLFMSLAVVSYAAEPVLQPTSPDTPDCEVKCLDACRLHCKLGCVYDCECKAENENNQNCHADCADPCAKNCQQHECKAEVCRQQCGK